MVVISASPSTEDRRLERTQADPVPPQHGGPPRRPEGFQNVTVASVVVSDPESAPAQIDAALVAMLTHRRPIYIEVLQNVWTLPCAAPSRDAQPRPQGERSELARRRRRSRVGAHPGGPTCRFSGPGSRSSASACRTTLQQIVDASGLPFTTTSLGKTVLDEAQPRFVGHLRRPRVPGAHAGRDEGHRLPDRPRHDHHRRLPRHHEVELRPDDRGHR